MSPSEEDQHPINVISKYVLIVLSIVGTLLILGWLLKYSAYGFDFTDESFYLVWIANPFIYDFSITQFGFFYHPLYLLLNGDIAALRQANILITFSLAWCLAFIFLGSLAPESKSSPITLYAAAAGLATSVLTLFEFWLITPNYNSLTLQAMLTTGIGLLLAEKTVTRKSSFGWIAIGIGGWMTFMAKPSTALVLALGVFIYLLVSRKLFVRQLLLAVASAILLLLVSAILIDGSMAGFIERLKLGIEFAEYLDGGHSLAEILRVDDFQLGKDAKNVIGLIFVASFFAVCSAWSNKIIGLFICFALSFSFLALTALLPTGEIRQFSDLGQFQGLIVFGLVFAAPLIALILGRVTLLKKITASQWAIAALFVVAPHIYAFGTNGNYWQTGGWAGFFWLLAAITLLGPIARDRSSWLFVLPLVLATQAVATTILQKGLEQPYRQPQPLRFNSSPLELGPQKSTLMLSEGYARYINDAVKVAQNAGYKATVPVIDLSGQSPGILYAFGAENIGQAWTIGGYAGSLKLASAALRLTSCEKIAQAWVLFEIDGPRNVSTQLLTDLGAVFPEGYERMGSWQTAEGAGGYVANRVQELYKPIATAITRRACEALREKEAQ